MFQILLKHRRGAKIDIPEYLSHCSVHMSNTIGSVFNIMIAIPQMYCIIFPPIIYLVVTIKPRELHPVRSIEAFLFNMDQVRMFLRQSGWYSYRMFSPLVVVETPITVVQYFQERRICFGQK